MNFNDKQKEEFSFQALGTNCEFIIYGCNAKYIGNIGKREVEIFEKNFSSYDGNSEIGKINKNSGKLTELSRECFDLIKKSIFYSELTEGFFDITIKPLVNLWSVGKDNFNIPSDKTINKYRELVDYKKIELREQSSEIKLNSGQQIDLGAIAKGYMADKLKDIFVTLGVKSGIINLGGNIVLIGSNINEKTWTIGIQDPFENRGEYVGIISLIDKSIVTSGVYERFSIKDNKVYSHIINPKTAYPIVGEILSISIISNKSIDGDGLSTGLYILGIEKSLKILKELNLDGIFITKDKKVIITEGIRKNFILTNEEFNIV